MMIRISLLYFIFLMTFSFSSLETNCQGDYNPADVHPLEYYASSAVNKYDWDDPAAKHLILENIEGDLTANELNGLKNYLLEYQLPTHNHTNYYFRKRINSYMMEWMYEKTGDKNLLDKAIQVADRAIEYRNDNFGKHIISFDRGIAPVWPNFKKIETYEDSTIGLIPGAGVFGPIPCLTVPARIIAENPDLWEKTFNSETYYDIALRLIDEAFVTIDYTYDIFVGEDNLIRYPETLLRTEWHGRLFIYNRVFPIISGSIPLIEALEIFEIKKDRIEQIETVNQSMMNYLYNDMIFYGPLNAQCVRYPYSEAAQERNPDQVEDFTHGSLDSRDFQHFYTSAKYGFSEKYVKAIANTLVDIVAKGDGIFSYRMDGSGGDQEFDSPISYDGFIWYASYRTEIKDLIINHIIDNEIVVRDGIWDAFCLFEIFKLKEKDFLNSTRDSKSDSKHLSEILQHKIWVNNNTIHFNWSQVGEVQVFDMTGRILIHENDVNNSLQLDSPVPGMYLVRTSKRYQKVLL